MAKVAKNRPTSVRFSPEKFAASEALSEATGALQEQVLGTMKLFDEYRRLSLRRDLGTRIAELEA